MQPTTTLEMTSINSSHKETSVIALLFFLMGAMNVYLFLRRQRDVLNQRGYYLLKVGLVSVTCAALLEWVFF
ncbi:MAG: hypothetical protein RLZZ568_749 [Cyanobacteriota bacterium]|jgi:uncharacterized membrane protein YiaA